MTLWNEVISKYSNYQKYNIFNPNAKGLCARFNNIVNKRTRGYDFIIQEENNDNKSYLLFSDKYLSNVINNIKKYLNNYNESNNI